MTSLSVVIVSYNVRDLLRNCLCSIFASANYSTDWLSVNVIVVDNASADGSAEMVRTEFPQVHLIASVQNLGFTGGNNLALKSLGLDNRENNRTQPTTHTDFVLLLNPDTELIGDTLGRMAAFLRDHPTAGACGARLQYGNGQFQHGAFTFPTLSQVMLDLLPLAEIPGVRRFLPRLLNSRINGRYPQHLWRGRQPFPVDFVLGAAMMVRAEAIQQVGLLDEDFFMYCEEIDWALRLHQAGWNVFALPTAHVIHYEGQSSKQIRWAAFERLWRSRFHFFRKHTAQYPPGYAVAVEWIVHRLFTLRRWQSYQRFGRGEITGEELAMECNIYAKLGESTPSRRAS